MIRKNVKRKAQPTAVKNTEKVTWVEPLEKPGDLVLIRVDPINKSDVDEEVITTSEIETETEREDS